MNQLQHSRPLLLGVLAGALAPAIFIAIVLRLSPDRLMIPIMPTALAAFFISLAISSIAGLPLAFWLRSRQRLKTFPLCMAGLVIGAVVTGIFNFQMNYWPQMNDQSLAKWIAWNSAMKGVMSGALFGLVSSIGFCIGAGVVFRRNLLG